MTEKKGNTDPVLAPEEREVCVSFHVPMQKIAKFVRLERPRVASQLSQCYGAGTGCGWCIPFLEKIFEQVNENPGATPDLEITQGEYLERRRAYHRRIHADRMKDTPGHG